MSDRYVTVVLRMTEEDAARTVRLVDLARANLKGVLQVTDVAPHELAGMWVTDYLPEDPTKETRHIIQLGEYGWTLQHPHACRATGHLFDCPVNQAVTASRAVQSGGVAARLGCGRYAVSLNKSGGLTFGERIDD